MKKFNGTLPLGIPSGKNIVEEVGYRLSLLKKMDFYYEEMFSFIEKTHKKNLTAKDISSLWGLLKNRELEFTEVDRGILFTNALVENLENIDVKILSALDNNRFNTFRDFGEDDKAITRKLKSGFSSFSNLLLYIRAKLAFRELAYVVLRDNRIVVDLLKITLKYLSCPTVGRIIETEKDKRIYLKQGKAESKKFIKQVSECIQGNTKSKKREIWYWRSHYLFIEIRCCIECYNRDDTTDEKNGYLTLIGAMWAIPDSYISLIKTKSDSPTNLTLGILEARGIIQPDTGTQFLAGYNRNVKRNKEATLALALYPEEIYSFFDLMNVEPLFFTKFDPFEYLNKANYIQLLNQSKNKQ